MNIPLKDQSTVEALAIGLSHFLQKRDRVSGFLTSFLFPMGLTGIPVLISVLVIAIHRIITLQYFAHIAKGPIGLVFRMEQLFGLK